MFRLQDELFIPVHGLISASRSRLYGVICDYAIYSQQKHMICNLCMLLFTNRVSIRNLIGLICTEKYMIGSQ